MLGNVARDLRLLGYDAEFRPELPDPALLGLAQRDGRILVTRDRALHRRARGVRCVLVTASDPRRQTAEVLRALPPHHPPRPWTRCLVCNGRLEPADRDRVLQRVPDHVAVAHDRFLACPGCGRVYWAGSHTARLGARLRALAAFTGSRRSSIKQGSPTGGDVVSESVAVYPGSFDPITNGHVDIIQRTAEVFDRVVVLVAVNRDKRTLFSVDERMGLIGQVFADHPRVEVDAFQGLLVEYMRRNGYRVVVRGLRAVSDFEYEFQMALMNRKIYPSVDTFFLAARENYSYVSSRILKEVFELGGCIKDLAPPVVIEALQAKYGRPPTNGGER